VEMRLVIDTNANSALARADAGIIDIVERADTLFMPFIVIAELIAGFAMGD